MAKKHNGGQAEAAEPKTERRLMYEVRLKPGHPTGVYRRGGMEFYRTAPAFIEDRIEPFTSDPWLIVAEEPVEIEWDKGDEVENPET